ncbi:ATPase [Cupriavidus sp. UYMMa02A]|nr:ATPase [Cupriavidus sp. UYMMa02A]
MFKLLAAILLGASLLLPAAATAGETPAPPNAYLYIGFPNNGQVLPAGKPFKVWFGLRNMGVAPKDVKFPKTGHHHLLIDVDLPPMDKEIPNDRNHLHFGAGETETMVELPPGKHTLQLLMGDDKHIPTNPPVYSKKITIYVK